MEIDEKGQLIYVWGLCPLVNCEDTLVFPQNYDEGCIVAELSKPPIPGISYTLNSNRWPLYINVKHGWICIGNPKILNNQMIEFAPNCVATMEGVELIALWLRPKKLPNFCLPRTGSRL